MGVVYNYLIKHVPHKVLGAPVLVDIQNVVVYAMEAAPSLSEADMNLAPPWDYSLFEWDVDVPLVQSERHGEYFTHHGLLLDSSRRTAEAGWDFDAALYFASGVEQVYEYFRYSGTVNADGTPGKLYAENGVSFQNDEAVVNVATGEATDLSTAAQREDRQRELMRIRYSYLHMVFMALTFANCHNVVVRDTVPRLSRQVRREMARRGEPVVTYKTLVIPGVSTRYENASGASGVRHPARKLHLCRGHFAHHENLFGRLGPRTVWVPAHVKGTVDTGVVVKDYSIGP